MCVHMYVCAGACQQEEDMKGERGDKVRREGGKGGDRSVMKSRWRVCDLYSED